MVKRNPISPSDWINFIQGEISSELTIMLSMVAAIFLIILSLMQMSIIVGDLSFIGINGEMPSIVTIAFEFGFIMFFVFIYIILLIRPKEYLCKKIIKGELTKHNEILKEYEEKIEVKIKWLERIKKKK